MSLGRNEVRMPLLVEINPVLNEAYMQIVYEEGKPVVEAARICNGVINSEGLAIISTLARTFSSPDQLLASHRQNGSDMSRWVESIIATTIR